MVSRTDKGIRASIRDMGMAVFCGMAYLLLISLRSGLVQGKASLDISASPSVTPAKVPKAGIRSRLPLRAAARALTVLPLLPAKKYSRATDEEASGGALSKESGD